LGSEAACNMPILIADPEADMCMVAVSHQLWGAVTVPLR
jgi:hypothetical protein